jgi:hypothetical protein
MGPDMAEVSAYLSLGECIRSLVARGLLHRHERGVYGRPLAHSHCERAA